MNRNIKVNRIEVRTQVHSACHALITDKDIAEKVYMKVINYHEDYLSDCEEDEIDGFKCEEKENGECPFYAPSCGL